MRPAPAPSIPPAALKAAGPRKLIAAGTLAAAFGVFAHCILPLL